MSSTTAAPRIGRLEDEFTGEHHVYLPHRVGIPPLRSYLRELWRRREFAFELARTDMRAQHLDTAFGRVWLVLNPLLLAGVYFLLVDIVRRGHSRGPIFLAHLIAGIFAYYFFSGAIREGAKTVVSGGRLVLNTAFPRALLPISSVIESFLRFIPTVLIFFVIGTVTNVPYGAHDLWVIPLVLILTATSLGLAMFVSALQVYFRDLTQLLPYILRVWMYACPILWKTEDITKSSVPHYLKFALLYVNPVGSWFANWSRVLIEGHAPSGTWMLASLCWAVGLVVAGGVFFMSREREFAVRL